MVPMPDNTDMLRKYRGNRRVSPRPAVVRTTWCDFSLPQEQQQLGTNIYNNSNHSNEDMQHKWFQNEVCHQQQTLIAEHSVEWDEGKEDQKNDSSLILSENIDATSCKDPCKNEIDPYCDVYEHQNTNLNSENNSSAYPMQILKSTNMVRQKSKRKRVFQKFWCATDEDDEEFQELPRPDAYRLKSRLGNPSGQKLRSKPTIGSSFKRKFMGGVADEAFVASNDFVYQEETDERGGIRRRPKVWDCLDETEPEFKKDAKIYAPKRPPPILDFFMVVTSFFVAAVLAYYSAT